jgi:RNA polymerase sigma-70 factor, ECF subfamily
MPDSEGESWNWSQIRDRCSLEAKRMLRRPQDAEEVVQEALARAWRSRRACRTPEAPLPWCLQITRNEALRLMQRQRNVWTELLDPHHEIEDRRELGAPDRTHERIDIGRALGLLTASERVLIGLRYEHDYSHPEIAARLEIPETTARVRLHRAQKRLKALLEEHA